MSVADFYDWLAADYHLVYGGAWEAAVDAPGRCARPARAVAARRLGG